MIAATIANTMNAMTKIRDQERPRLACARHVGEGAPPDRSVFGGGYEPRSARADVAGGAGSAFFRGIRIVGIRRGSETITLGSAEGSPGCEDGGVTTALADTTPDPGASGDRSRGSGRAAGWRWFCCASSSTIWVSNAPSPAGAPSASIESPSSDFAGRRCDSFAAAASLPFSAGGTERAVLTSETFAGP